MPSLTCSPYSSTHLYSSLFHHVRVQHYVQWKIFKVQCLMCCVFCAVCSVQREVYSVHNVHMCIGQCGFFEYCSSGSEDDRHYQLSVEPRAQQRQAETNTTKPLLPLCSTLKTALYSQCCSSQLTLCTKYNVLLSFFHPSRNSLPPYYTWHCLNSP